MRSKSIYNKTTMIQGGKYRLSTYALLDAYNTLIAKAGLQYVYLIDIKISYVDEMSNLVF